MVGPSISSADPPSEEDDDFVGPLPPAPANDQGDSAQDAALQAFKQREERMRTARELAEKEAAAQANSRPEWMVGVPGQSSLRSLVGDPLKLKSRGFSQNTRVQSRPTVGTSAPQDSRLWTETPAEKAIRLREEAEGKRPRLSEGSELTVDQRLEHVRESRRAAAIEESIRKGDESRSRSLLDLHQEKRRKEHLEKSSHKRRRSASPSSRKRSSKREHDQSDGSAPHDSDESHEARSRHHRRKSDHEHSERHRHSGRESNRERERDRRSGSSRHSGRDRDRDRDRHRDKDRHREGSGRHRHSERSAEHRKEKASKESDDDDSVEGRSSKHRKHRDSREDRKRDSEKRAREKEALSKVGSWDWESAMGAGGRILDEGAKKKIIKDAAGLSDRFGRGGASYL